MSTQSIDVRDVPGALVLRAHVGQGFCSVVRGEVPGDDKLCNFVVTGDGTNPPEDGEPPEWWRPHPVDLLVLDAYGNDQWPDALNARVFGEGAWALAIDRRDGALYRASFVHDPEIDGLAMFAHRLGNSDNPEAPVVPEGWLPRLGELRFKKRPFRVAVDPFAALEVIDGEEGYAHLRDRLIVHLDFDDAALEISGDHHRVVGPWQVSAVAPEDESLTDAELANAGRRGQGGPAYVRRGDGIKRGGGD